MAPEDYLAFEREAEGKHEFWDGEIVAMAGGSPEHNAICFNLAASLGPQLRGSGCRGFTSDQKVRVPLENRYVYPDLTVVCGQAVFEGDDASTLANPALIVEVLSPTTEDDGRGRKLFGYRTLPSLRGYLLVAQDRTWVEYWSRQDGGTWLVREIDDRAATLELSEIGCKLPLSEIYEGVDLTS
jgi:Uma2 family endonuclease